MEAVVASFTQMEQITAALEKAVEFKENKLERALEQFGATSCFGSSSWPTRSTKGICGTCCTLHRRKLRRWHRQLAENQQRHQQARRLSSQSQRRPR